MSTSTSCPYPVAIFGFNRPNEFKRVLDEALKAHPKKLYIVLDGPRNETEVESQKQMKAWVDELSEKIPVETNYSQKNLGCKVRISSGIDWVFSKEEAAIFLEDDCLPSQNFFTFTSQLLTHFKDNEQIGIISGYNPLLKETESRAESYYFSKYPHIWGWASWSRVWKNYDVTFSKLNSHGPRLIEEFSHNPDEIRFWTNHFNKVASGEINTWDAQVTFMFFQQSYFCILPTGNLIENIGFSEGATHTVTSEDHQTNPIVEVATPIIHPASQTPDLDYQRAKTEYQIPHIALRAIKKLQSLL